MLSGSLSRKSVESRAADPMERPFVLKPVDEGSSVGVAIVRGDSHPRPLGEGEGPWRQTGGRRDHQVTVDGQVERTLETSETVVVSREERPVGLVRLANQSFFRTMRTKLNWAARPPERS